MIHIFGDSYGTVVQSLPYEQVTRPGQGVFWRRRKVKWPAGAGVSRERIPKQWFLPLGVPDLLRDVLDDVDYDHRTRS
jgi:hypothetical protein